MNWVLNTNFLYRVILGVLAMLISSPAMSQWMCRGGDCPMGHGGMMYFGSALGIILVVAVITALMALTIYLVRRSRPPHQH